MKNYLLMVIILQLLLAEGQDLAIKDARALAKGEKIAQKLCDRSRLPKVAFRSDLKEIEAAIIKSGACIRLSSSKIRALALFLQKGALKADRGSKQKITVSKGAKCPVCGMFVSKYPKWAAMMSIGGKSYYFDGVKDMMKFYIFDADFPYDRSKIDKMLVSDFYTLEAILAKSAYYVIGSKLYGPMGNELIPFKSEKEAKDFIKDHGGERIVRFKDINAKMLMSLDGIKYDKE